MSNAVIVPQRDAMLEVIELLSGRYLQGRRGLSGWR